MRMLLELELSAVTVDICENVVKDVEDDDRITEVNKISICILRLGHCVGWSQFWYQKTETTFRTLNIQQF